MILTRSAATLSAESQLLLLRAALLASPHIYASYDRSLVEQELRGYGIDLEDPPPAPPEAGARKRRR